MKKGEEVVDMVAGIVHMLDIDHIADKVLVLVVLVLVESIDLNVQHNSCEWGCEIWLHGLVRVMVMKMLLW